MICARAEILSHRLSDEIRTIAPNSNASTAVLPMQNRCHLRIYSRFVRFSDRHTSLETDCTKFPSGLTTVALMRDTVHTTVLYFTRYKDVPVYRFYSEIVFASFSSTFVPLLYTALENCFRLFFPNLYFIPRCKNGFSGANIVCTVCMYVWSSHTRYSRVWINRVRLPILLVVS